MKTPKALPGLLSLLLTLTACTISSRDLTKAPTEGASADQGRDEYISNEPARESAGGMENVPGVPSDQPTYSNLANESSMAEVRDIFLNAGIQEKYVDTVFNWVADYNDCMRDCPSFSLTGDFTAMDGMVVDYGDYYAMFDQWYKSNHRNYHDVVCRIAAYELTRDNISVADPIEEENFDCWDEDAAWLYTDGSILFGRNATETDQKTYVPFPLIDWDKDVQESYFTLFDSIGISEQCGEKEMVRAIQEEWAERGISFRESTVSLITFWTQNGDRICASHAAVLIETDSGYLLFEKTNPESPYAATKFSSVDEVKTYLHNMMELDYSKYQEQLGTYVVMRNSKQI